MHTPEHLLWYGIKRKTSKYDDGQSYCKRMVLPISRHLILEVNREFQNFHCNSTRSMSKSNISDTKSNVLWHYEYEMQTRINSRRYELIITFWQRLRIMEIFFTRDLASSGNSNYKHEKFISNINQCTLEINHGRNKECARRSYTKQITPFIFLSNERQKTSRLKI